MKKVIILMLCVLMLMIPLSVSAEEATDAVTEGEEVVEVEDTTPEEETPAEDEIPGEEYAPGDVFEGEVIVPEETPEEVPEDTDAEAEINAITEMIVGWIEDNWDKISLVVTAIATILYYMKELGVLKKSVGVLNNNSITVAQNSEASITEAKAVMQAVGETLGSFKVAVEKITEEYKQTAEDNKALNKRLVDFEKHLKNAKAANVELSNEVAELLVLANIPNSKKDELYSRHRAAVALIEAAEVTEDEAEEE